MSVECASEGVREGVAVALFATAPLLWALLRHWRSSSSSSSSDSGSGSKGSGGVREREAVSVCGSGAHVLRPGLVLLRGALDERAQTLLAERLFLHGHTRGKWWAREKQHGREQCVLNNHRQGRGRIYDALHSYEDQEEDELLRGVCCDSVALARRLDPAMPPLHCPTHLLTLYYTSSRKLGWHRDNGAQDGQSECPVVSVSLGNSCDFLYRDETKDDALKVVLRSGDVLLFGGPSRHILHSVSTVHEDTCSPELLEVQRRALAGAPPKLDGDAAVIDPSALKPPRSFRLNLTFRHAPELLGQEHEERFYFFARSARKFLDLAKRMGVVQARQVANEARRAKRTKPSKKEKRKQLRDGQNSIATGGSSSTDNC